MRLRQYEHQDPDKALSRRDRWLLDLDPAKAQMRVGKLRSARINGLAGVTYAGGAGFKLSQTVGGLWVPAAANDPGETDAGFGSWEARTNSIRNPTGLGAVVGDVSTTGALPTNWGRADGITGLTMAVTGTGVESGLPGVYVRVSGTPGSTTEVRFAAEINSVQIAGANGQTWTAEWTTRLAAGSLANVGTAFIATNFRTAAGATLTSALGAGVGLTAALQRIALAATATDPTTAAVSQQLRISVTAGLAVDFTLFLAAPQQKLGVDIQDPPILQTNNLAATRTADVLVRDGILLPASGATIYAEVSLSRAVASPSNEYLASISDGTLNNRMTLFRVQGTDAMGLRLTLAGSNIVTTASASGALGAGVHRVAMTCSPGRTVSSLDGVNFGQAAPASVPPCSRLSVGVSENGLTGWLNGLVRRTAILPPMGDAALSALTTSGLAA